MGEVGFFFLVVEDAEVLEGGEPLLVAGEVVAAAGADEIAVEPLEDGGAVGVEVDVLVEEMLVCGSEVDYAGEAEHARPKEVLDYARRARCNPLWPPRARDPSSASPPSASLSSGPLPSPCLLHPSQPRPTPWTPPALNGFTPHNPEDVLRPEYLSAAQGILLAGSPNVKQQPHAHDKDMIDMTSL